MSCTELATPTVPRPALPPTAPPVQLVDDDAVFRQLIDASLDATRLAKPLTGVSDVASIRRAYDAGAASYLVRPIAFAAPADVLRGVDTRWMLL